MKLQKITQKRWFWPLVCAVSVVFGWWYLSIVTCAPLGGDDELINLQNYYYITHTSFGQSVLDYLGDLWEQFSLQNGRFRPFSSPPVRGLTSWFLGDLVGYRLYILAWTYADIVLTAWLVGKASRNKKLGIACLCLLPMMFSVWQDSTGNSLYSYGALVQSTLLPALVAGLAVLRWQDTGHKRWAVLAGYCMFQCCATCEIGCTYIVPIFGLAWLYTDKARDALRLSIPALLGECVTLAFNMGARLMNTLRAAGILEGSVSQIEGISPNFDLPAILRTWAMQMSAGFPLNAMLFGKLRPGKREQKLIASCEKLGYCVQLNRPTGAALQAMARDWAKETGADFAPGAEAALLARCGEDQFLLKNEVEKLAALANYSTITKEMVSRLGTVTLDADTFDMVKLLTSGQADKAQQKLKTLLALQNEPIMIAGALISNYLDLYRVLLGRRSRRGLGDVAKDFGYKGNWNYRLNSTEKTALRFKRAQLEECLHILQRLDTDLKSSKLDADLLMQKALCELALAGRA